MVLNFWKVLPLPFNKEGGGARRRGVPTVRLLIKRWNFSRMSSFRAQNSISWARVITNDAAWSLKLKKMKSFSYHPKVH